MNISLLVVAGCVTLVAAIRGTWSPCGLSMISAINPLAERARGNAYWLTSVWFVIGSILGGAALGLLMSALAKVVATLGLPLAFTLASGAVMAGLTLGSDLGRGLVFPGIPRQVNETWLVKYRRWIYAAGFGVQIGFGFGTYVMTAANYLMVFLASLTGDVRSALLVGVAFGFTRGLAVLLTCRTSTPSGLLRLHARLERLSGASVTACLLTQAATCVILGALAGEQFGRPIGALFGAMTGLAMVALVRVLPRWTSPAVDEFCVTRDAIGVNH